MIKAGRALGALLALCLVPLSASVAKAPATRDWSKTYWQSSAGGFGMGSPTARLKVIEYGSLTCPHCRHFAQDAVSPFVSRYVRSGRASYEFRPMVLNAQDLAATLIARCGGPSRFFPLAATLYATQPVWTAREIALPDGIADQQIPLKVAQDAGLLPVASAGGIAPAAARSCLTSEPAQLRLSAMYQAALDAGVPGTPAIMINGKLTPVWDWKTLQEQLRKAGS
ncbi:MAG: thioredoxin domain-containing protein [Sphingomicrobium sp.]